MAERSERFLEVERLGGLAGIGGPRARLRSRGRVAVADLTDGERAAVEKLFARGDAAPTSAARDAFRYRITRTVGARTQVVEVPEAETPAKLSASVKDELR